MVEEKFTKRDLEVASELGALSKVLHHMNDKLDGYCKNNNEQHEKMWAKLDKHNSFIKWIMGLGTGVSALIAWIFKHI